MRALRLVILAGVASFILSRTSLGRFTFAMGSNEEALRLSGVNIDGWKIAVYALAGAICAEIGAAPSRRCNHSRWPPSSSMAMTTFQLFLRASASQAAIIFLQSSSVRQGLVFIGAYVT